MGNGERNPPKTLRYHLSRYAQLFMAPSIARIRNLLLRRGMREHFYLPRRRLDGSKTFFSRILIPLSTGLTIAEPSATALDAPIPQDHTDRHRQQEQPKDKQSDKEEFHRFS